MVETTQRYPTSQRLLLAALWFELLALTVKLAIGAQTNSLALLATTLYSAIAAVSAIYAIVATYNLQRCGRPIWGHQTWETGLALLLTGSLGYGGFTLIGVALQTLAAAHHLQQIPPIVVTNAQLQTLFLFGLASLSLAWVQKRSAKRYRILALTTNGDQILQEALISLSLLLILFGVQIGYTWLDPLFTLGLTFGAGYSAWQMLKRQLPLMVRQIAIDPGAIGQVVRQVDGITHCDQIESRGIVGRQVLITLRLMIHPEFLGTEGQIMQSVEAVLRQTYGPVKVSVQIDSDWNGLQAALTEASSSSRYQSEADRH
jgi:divalent metal cation (Fe/Co/Zn/Cd) transporter